MLKSDNFLSKLQQMSSLLVSGTRKNGQQKVRTTKDALQQEQVSPGPSVCVLAIVSVFIIFLFHLISLAQQSV